jgi:hypothetical protein
MGSAKQGYTVRKIETGKLIQYLLISAGMKFGTKISSGTVYRPISSSSSIQLITIKTDTLTCVQLVRYLKASHDKLVTLTDSYNDAALTAEVRLYSVERGKKQRMMNSYKIRVKLPSSIPRFCSKSSFENQGEFRSVTLQTLIRK